MRTLRTFFFASFATILVLIACNKPKATTATPKATTATTSPSTSSTSSKSDKDGFLDSLMSKMTVEEKIGQLNLPSIGFDVTGPLLSTDVEGKIKRGQV